MKKRPHIYTYEYFVEEARKLRKVFQDTRHSLDTCTLALKRFTFLLLRTKDRKQECTVIMNALIVEYEEGFVKRRLEEKAAVRNTVKTKKMNDAQKRTKEFTVTEGCPLGPTPQPNGSGNVSDTSCVRHKRWRQLYPLHRGEMVKSSSNVWNGELMRDQRVATVDSKRKHYRTFKTQEAVTV